MARFAASETQIFVFAALRFFATDWVVVVVSSSIATVAIK